MARQKYRFGLLCGHRVMLLLVMQFFCGLRSYSYAGTHEFAIPPGDEALLLGGAFAASAHDATGLYYNPAGLASVPSTRLSGSTQGFMRQHSEYDINAFEQNRVFHIASEGVVPGVLGGVSRPKWSNDWTVGFVVLSLNQDIVQQFKKYGAKLAQEFVVDVPKQGRMYRRFLRGALSDEAFDLFVKKMQQLELEFSLGATRPALANEHQESVAIYHCIRSWKFSVLENYRRSV